MRKTLLFFAALLFMAVPVMATDVNIICTVEGNAVTVSYQDSNPGTLVRAFALDINVWPEDVNIKKVDVLDPCIYRIFPGQIDIVDGEIINYSTPYAAADINDANITIEMGSLYTMDVTYAGDPNAGYNKKPGRSGNLVKFYVNKSCSFTVDANAFRGGIVMEDPTETPNTNLPRHGNVTLLTECLNSAIAPAAEYNAWVAWGRPNCWCYARQCRGDADGKKSVNYWVATVDLTLLKTCLNKADTILKNIPNGICADFDHTKSVNYRVATPDLNLLKTYLNKAVTIVPCCDADKDCVLTPADKYNFWVVP